MNNNWIVILVVERAIENGSLSNNYSEWLKSSSSRLAAFCKAQYTKVYEHLRKVA